MNSCSIFVPLSPKIRFNENEVQSCFLLCVYVRVLTEFYMFFSFVTALYFVKCFEVFGLVVWFGFVCSG